MHTFLTVTATGIKFGLSVIGRNHGDAFKHATNVANGCTVKHDTYNEGQYQGAMADAFRAAGLRV